jgi:hypothetical protein
MYHLLQHTKTLHSAHTVYLCVLYGSHNKQQLFPQMPLTSWALQRWRSVFPVRYGLDLYIKLWRNSVSKGLSPLVQTITGTQFFTVLTCNVRGKLLQWMSWESWQFGRGNINLLGQEWVLSKGSVLCYARNTMVLQDPHSMPVTVPELSSGNSILIIFQVLCTSSGEIPSCP